MSEMNAPILRLSVGMPWEIIRAIVNDRSADLYTKSGNIGAYSSVIVLVPDYAAGFVILGAEGNVPNDLTVLADIVSDKFLPALEQAARDQASTDFAGSYALDTMNSSITLAVEDGKPGIGIDAWISNGSDILAAVALLTGRTGHPDVRLCPTGLMTQAGENQQVAFRALIPVTYSSGGNGYFSQVQYGDQWEEIDQAEYGQVAVNEFLFELDGEAHVLSVTPRALRVTLPKRS
ncbi:hypothetical protein LTR66_007781 [Elasticomyces elasticus]|nr:hypothetical protein LTR66_007781 [Elasticomyces elasticus]KAK5010157.1 hypothetical protein LTR28_011503 [Elasticomyces elasticus]